MPKTTRGNPLVPMKGKHTLDHIIQGYNSGSDTNGKPPLQTDRTYKPISRNKQPH
jgi:hypothetical protein